MPWHHSHPCNFQDLPPWSSLTDYKLAKGKRWSLTVTQVDWDSCAVCHVTTSVGLSHCDNCEIEWCQRIGVTMRRITNQPVSTLHIKILILTHKSLALRTAILSQCIPYGAKFSWFLKIIHKNFIWFTLQFFLKPWKFCPMFLYTICLSHYSIALLGHVNTISGQC